MWRIARLLRVIRPKHRSPALSLQEDSTALFVAASKGHVETLRVLLAAGADPLATDAVSCTEVCRRTMGWWRLRAPCRMLVASGRLASSQLATHLQSGWAPLHAAAAIGHAPVVALLLATPGVDPLLKTGMVRGACSGGRLTTLSPTPTLATLYTLQQGRTALDMARRWKHGDAVALLEADSRVAAALVQRQRQAPLSDEVH